MELITTTLSDRLVRLEPLAERHREPFRQAISDDEATWTLLMRRWSGEDFDPEWTRNMAEHVTGRRLCYAIVVDGRCGGMSCFIDPDAQNATVEIGGTWLHPSLRGGATNPASKRLMLDHAFQAGARRVQIKVDAANARSMAAVAKLGAVVEGILRQDRVTWTGRVRDTAVHSILRDEWPTVRQGLDRRLEPGHADL